MLLIVDAIKAVLDSFNFPDRGEDDDTSVQHKEIPETLLEQFRRVVPVGFCSPHCKCLDLLSGDMYYEILGCESRFALSIAHFFQQLHCLEYKASLDDMPSFETLMGHVVTAFWKARYFSDDVPEDTVIEEKTLPPCVVGRVLPEVKEWCKEMKASLNKRLSYDAAVAAGVESPLVTAVQTWKDAGGRYNHGDPLEDTGPFRLGNTSEVEIAFYSSIRLPNESISVEDVKGMKPIDWYFSKKAKH